VPTTVTRLLASVAVCSFALATPSLSAQNREAHLEEASANFDLEDLRPFLERVVALLDSGFTPADVEHLASKIAAQRLDSQKVYEYTVVAHGIRTPLRVEVFMDDIDSPDIAFFTEPGLAKRIQAAILTYFDEVGK
jgi:hypothetical protein